MPRPRPQQPTALARFRCLCALLMWMAPRMMPITENPHRLVISAPTAMPSASATGQLDRSSFGAGAWGRGQPATWSRP